MYIDIETIDSVDTENAPEPIPTFTVFDPYTKVYTVFCFGFKKIDTLQAPLKLQEYWKTNTTASLLKYSFQSSKIDIQNFQTERQMLGSFIGFIKKNQPDIICAWNIAFDLPYLIKRMEKLELPSNALSEVGKVYLDKNRQPIIEGCVCFDSMESFAAVQFQELRSKSLDFCANCEFKTGKMPRTSIKEMLVKNPSGLLAYNIVDVQLTVALTEQSQLISNANTIEEICNAGLDNQSPLRIIDSFIMSYLKPLKIAVPTNVYVKGDGKKEGGAFVHKASVGKHQNIIILDFRGYYTSVMMDGNMCASTFVTRDEIRQALIGKTISDKTFVTEADITEIILDDIINKYYVHCPNGAIFRKDIKGIIPEILIHVKNERTRHKKLMKEAKDEQTKNVEDRLQSGFKRIGNIFYGQFKNPHFRLMNKAIAEAITSVCKALTIRTIDTIEHLNDKDMIDLLSKYKDVLKLPDDVFTTLSQKLSSGVLTVKYGDSVVKDTIVLVKNESGEISFEKIENLFKNVDCSEGDKEYYLPKNIQTLTIDKNGKSVWRQIKNVMRHKTNKKVKKVSITNQWSVSVTEDHSLMGFLNCLKVKNGCSINDRIIEVKPDDIGKDCKSLITLKYIPRTNIITKNYPKELYQFMGLFIGNGSYAVKFGEKNYYLYLSNDHEKGKDVLDKVIIPLRNKGYITNYWWKKNGFDLCVNGLDLCHIMDGFRNLDGKIIPEWIFKETPENLSYFVSGLFDSDGSISKRGEGYIITYTSTKIDLLNNIQKILWYIGIPSGICKESTCNSYLGKVSGTYSHRLNIRNNFNFKERIKYITTKKQAALDDVHISAKKIVGTENEFDTSGKIIVEDIAYNDYVYDLEVEDTHTFFANGFLASNTDSIFTQLPPSLDSKEMRFMGLMLEKYVNSLLPSFTKEMFNIDNKYIEIEFDTKKIMKSFIQMPAKTDKTRGAKKRYVYLAYNDDGTLNLTPNFVGMDVIRSDTAPLMAEIQTKVASMILLDKPYNELVAYLNDIYKNFDKQKVDSLLIKETIHAFDNAKSHSPQLIGAMYANAFLSKKFKPESTVYYIYIQSMPNGFPQHIKTKKWGIQPVKTLCMDYNESVPAKFLQCIDWQKMRELVVESPVETLLEAVGYTWSGVLTGTTQGKLKQAVIPFTNEFIDNEQPAQKIEDVEKQQPVKKLIVANSMEV